MCMVVFNLEVNLSFLALILPFLPLSLLLPATHRLHEFLLHRGGLERGLRL